MVPIDRFEIAEQAFGSTPDQRFLFFSDSHREALATLFCGVESNRGFSALIAPPGFGKTTILFRLLYHFGSRMRTVFLFDTQCSGRELLAYVLRDLGAVPGSDAVGIHYQLNDILLQENERSRGVLLVIDEAQNLDTEALESVRLLSNFERDNRKLLNVVLSGQLQLARTLARPELRQFAQRINSVCRLTALSRSETKEYVVHRLRIAGYDEPVPFTPGALNRVYDVTRGIPREINTLCFNALCIRRGRQESQVSESNVEEAAHDRAIFSTLALQDGAATRTESLPAESAVTFSASNGSQDPKAGKQSHPWSSRRMISGLTAAASTILLLIGLSSWSPTQSRSSRTSQPTGGNDLSAPAQLAPATIVTRPQWRIVTVQPRDTLESLSMKYLGRYDNLILTRLQALNPTLSNPNLIVVGEQLRLPGEMLVGETSPRQTEVQVNVK